MIHLYQHIDVRRVKYTYYYVLPVEYVSRGVIVNVSFFFLNFTNRGINNNGKWELGDRNCLYRIRARYTYCRMCTPVINYKFGVFSVVNELFIVAVDVAENNKRTYSKLFSLYSYTRSPRRDWYFAE